MAKLTAPTVGSQFTTAKSGVTGEVKEVIKNQTGSLRIRLDVNGQDRWTTVTKQLIRHSGLALGKTTTTGVRCVVRLKNCQTSMLN